MSSFLIDPRQPNQSLDLTDEGDRLLASALDRAREAVRLDDELRDAIQARINDVLIPITERVSGDGRSVQFQVGQLPELLDERWVYRLADVLHNYRAALDNMLWAIVVGTVAHLSDMEARQVQFPLTNSDIEFTRLLRKSVLGRLPSVVQARLRATQPLVLRERPSGSILHWLHGLDVTDKHRSSLSIEVRGRQDSLFQFLLLDEAGEDTEPTGWKTIYAGEPLRTGLALAEAAVPRPVALAHAVHLQPQFWVSYDGLHSDIEDLLNALRPQVLSVFELLQWGTAESISDAVISKMSFGPWNASRYQREVQKTHDLLGDIDIDTPAGQMTWKRESD